MSAQAPPRPDRAACFVIPALCLGGVAGLVNAQVPPPGDGAEG